MNKAMQAVIALGGDIDNSWENKGRGLKYLHLDKQGDYVCCTKVFEDTYICTVDEFNAAADEWRKEAHMHNAALDCKFDSSNIFCPRANHLWMGGRSGCYFGDNDANNEDRKHRRICTMQEFIDYCEANKPKKPSERMKKALDEAKEIEAKFLNLNCRCKISELTTIYNIDKPLKDLPDELAAELFNHWRNGGECEFFVCQAWFTLEEGHKLSPKTILRAAKPKSERDLFVERCDNSCVIHSNRESMMITFGELFDAGCRFTEQSK